MLHARARGSMSMRAPDPSFRPVTATPPPTPSSFLDGSISRSRLTSRIFGVAFGVLAATTALVGLADARPAPTRSAVARPTPRTMILASARPIVSSPIMVAARGPSAPEPAAPAVAAKPSGGKRASAARSWRAHRAAAKPPVASDELASTEAALLQRLKDTLP